VATEGDSASPRPTPRSRLPTLDSNSLARSPASNIPALAGVHRTTGCRLSEVKQFEREMNKRKGRNDKLNETEDMSCGIPGRQREKEGERRVLIDGRRHAPVVEPSISGTVRSPSCSARLREVLIKWRMAMPARRRPQVNYRRRWLVHGRISERKQMTSAPLTSDFASPSHV
jgi:hypothetical protein